MSYYFDRQGEPISVLRWAELFENFAYKVVRQDSVRGYLVSTIWLGLDHGYGRGAPIIFETMVFHRGIPSGLDSERYSTEEAARVGHSGFVKAFLCRRVPRKMKKRLVREEHARQVVWQRMMKGLRARVPSGLPFPLDEWPPARVAMEMLN